MKMTSHTWTVFVLVLFMSGTCLAQREYEGITPGKNSRGDVERQWGRPTRNVSGTLSEYLNSGRIDAVYVQYSNASANARVERIECVCKILPEQDNMCRTMFLYGLFLDRQPQRQAASRPDSNNDIRYIGAPHYVVESWINRPEKSLQQLRIALYSKELYEGAVPPPCSGSSLTGTWDTSIGKMTFKPVPPQGSGDSFVNMDGTLPINHGWLYGSEVGGIFKGSWRDDTGAGSVIIQISKQSTDTFTGTWTRTEGQGPRNGTWEGRCIQ